MLNVHELKAQDLLGLSPDALAEVAATMLQHISQQSSHIVAQDKKIADQAQAIKFRDVKIERITFELARLKAWRRGAIFGMRRAGPNRTTRANPPGP